MTRRLAILAALGLGLTTPPLAAATLNVDLGAPIKPVDHAASGALYGLAAPGWPAEDWIAPLHPKNFTQMAPGGGQLPNGETAPVGDALVVAPIAARAGASVTIRMPDVFPTFPYVWSDAAFWAAEVDRIARETVAAAPGNIYAYEIWNEPDWTWKPAWGDFNAVWAQTFHALRAIDAKTPILGPSATHFDADWFRQFLTAATASGSLPDIICWHELDPATASDIERHVADYRALETERGLTPRPIAINEYGAPRAMANPGALVPYIAQLERAGVDTANLAFWHRPGRLSDLLVPIDGGTGPAREAAPTGAYWLYAWYGALQGQMVQARGDGQAPDTIDGFAALDAQTHRAEIVLAGAAGPHVLAVKGLDGWGSFVDVLAEATHWSGTDGSLAAPEPVFSGRAAIVDGQIELPVTLVRASDALHVRLTAGSGPAPATALQIIPAPPRFVARLEAEDATFSGARKFRNRMFPSRFFANTTSGEGYVGILGKGPARIDFTLDLPRAAAYDLTVGFANGLGEAQGCRLSANGKDLGALAFPPTQGRELIGQQRLQADLSPGPNSVSLSCPSPASPPIGVPDVLEIDYLDVADAERAGD